MMQNIRAVGASALVVLLAACDIEPVPVEANGPARFVAGELLVKFKDTSDYGKRVAQAMALGERPPDVERLAQQLAVELDMPLMAVRVTSGRELLLNIDRAALGQRLTEQVRKNPAVRAAKPAPVAEAVLPTATLTLIVELAPKSDEHRKLQGRELDALARKLAPQFQPRPTGAMNQQGQFLLVINVADLTQDLVLRLKARADVDYAQVSHIFRPSRDAAPRK